MKAKVVWFNEHKGYGDLMTDDNKTVFITGDVLGGDMWGQNIPGGAPVPNEIFEIEYEKYDGSMNGVELIAVKAKKVAQDVQKIAAQRVALKRKLRKADVPFSNDAPYEDLKKLADFVFDKQAKRRVK